MNEQLIERLCAEVIGTAPRRVTRCSVGTGNYVYIVECTQKYIIRCSEDNTYEDTVYWLKQLTSLDIPVSKVIGTGSFQGYEYLILSYIEGRDIGLVYKDLSVAEKKEIARQVVDIQNKVAKLPLEKLPDHWTWSDFIEDMLNRAGERIRANGYFDIEKVERLQHEMGRFSRYFASVKPVAYLDDITTKNLLVHNGKLSGVIDVDWIGIGDRLTQPALTKMSLLNMECDPDYAQFILEDMKPDSVQRKAFTFYMLMYCVDFMGERGTRFMDKVVDVSKEIVGRLNRIYDELWAELQQSMKQKELRGGDRSTLARE